MEENLKFVREKVTPHTVRYKEVTEPGKPPIIGTLYVKDWWAGQTERLVVTIKKD